MKLLIFITLILLLLVTSTLHFPKTPATRELNHLTEQILPLPMPYPPDPGPDPGCGPGKEDDCISKKA